MTLPAVAVDASALVAILKGDSEAEPFLAVLDASLGVIGWPTVLEVRIWCLRRLGTLDEPWLAGWLAEPTTRVLAFDAELERLAGVAYDRFGKGRHPAALNFGDCMSYAVARLRDLPLLYKGADFARTDLNPHPVSVGRAS
jgi:ribonuclease VapC